MSKTVAFLRLMRPANIVTSVADVLAGIAISGFFSAAFSSINLLPVILLCISTMGLYGGGIVFNDVFDAELDKIERPERSIPSGIVSIKEASILGGTLLIIGVICAMLVNSIAGLFAIAIAVFALIYNKWGKHHKVLGPVNMGLCRGLNLLLGISILTASLGQIWFIAFLPVIYIASITLISHGEVHGGNKNTLYIASVLYGLVIITILMLAFTQNQLFAAMLILIPFAWLIFKPLLTAINNPIGKNIGKAVKAGVISLILMDAAWAAAFGAIYPALFILLLLPLSLKLARIFAVT